MQTSVLIQWHVGPQPALILAAFPFLTLPLLPFSYSTSTSLSLPSGIDPVISTLQFGLVAFGFYHLAYKKKKKKEWQMWRFVTNQSMTISSCAMKLAVSRVSLWNKTYMFSFSFSFSISKLNVRFGCSWNYWIDYYYFFKKIMIVRLLFASYKLLHESHTLWCKTGGCHPLCRGITTLAYAFASLIKWFLFIFTNLWAFYLGDGRKRWSKTQCNNLKLIKIAHKIRKIKGSKIPML